MKTDVIIIGAGPTGLSLACQFIRHGIDFIIVEQNEGVTALSKALGVHARTLEIYEQLGLAKQAIEQGTIAEQVKLITGGTIHDGPDLSTMGEGISAYPYMLVLEQSKNEQILYDYLQRHQKEVLWNTTLEQFSQTNNGVTAVVQPKDGEAHTIEAKYLVGCDGASSVVRNTLGFDFIGDTLERLFYVADTQIDWELDHNTLHACLGRDSFIFFFPMAGDRCWRILGNLPEQASPEELEMDATDLEERVKGLTGLSLDILGVNWYSSYRVHTRRVEQFSPGRCFLTGDSAHIHTPAGGQGMNTGIQDAYNLAWKLAFVLKGYSDESLLETYNQERLENAKNLVETTDQFFEFEAGSNWLVSLIRTTVLPPLAKHIFNIDVVQRGLFSLISQTGISYPDSALSHAVDDLNSKVKAGDRMPYFLLKGQSIYDDLHKPMFHLLTFSNEHEDQSISKEIKQAYGLLIDHHALPLSTPVAKAFGIDQPFSVLLRPDNYIGFITQDDPLSELTSYSINFKPA
ncbi:FAD-dependent monooxygenase [Acaryochloris sp. CCMEE 5410]|uniref:FAD-dependent monooxygenase n=1 Tax=Acaryochloris sp. CCMEE 5410 TaxID=310037 RepID=UPI0021D1DD3D|nr:FAD-dependent monooxygenase [Acaryochloris sp. CCMEE 5410]KAI9129114.1 FAD-dependent monooxygenase [Acaryochloris sp. CCMEE 5410]